MTLLSLLGKPVTPSINNLTTHLTVSVFISFFIIVFEPFGLRYFYSDYRVFILLGSGFVVFTVLRLNYYFFRLTVPDWFNENNWVLSKQIVLTLCVIISMTFAMYFYAQCFNISSKAGFENVLSFCRYTFSLSVFPVAGTAILAYVVYLKNRGSDYSENLNTSENRLIKIYSYNKTKEIEINPTTLVYIESKGNYIQINYYENHKLETIELRNTLKDIVKQLESIPYYLKVHRAFVVNMQYIQNFEGSSQNLKINLKLSDNIIPVARSMIKQVRDRVRNDSFDAGLNLTG